MYTCHCSVCIVHVYCIVVIILFFLFFVADETPYNITVFGANSAGNGSVDKMIVFTAEGSETYLHV